VLGVRQEEAGIEESVINTINVVFFSRVASTNARRNQNCQNEIDYYFLIRIAVTCSNCVIPRSSCAHAASVQPLARSTSTGKLESTNTVDFFIISGNLLSSRL